MQKCHTQKASPSSSNVSRSASGQSYRFAFSEELNAAYHPNFKKLSAKRQQLLKDQSLDLRQLFSLKYMEQAFMMSFQTRNKTCALCEFQYAQNEMFRLCNCEHEFCQNCLVEYVNYKVKAMEEIKCPDEFCVEKINLNCDIYKNLPEDIKIRYTKTALWRQTVSNPNLKLCPRQTCSGQVDMLSFPPTCSTCLRQYCPQCMMQQHEGNCDNVYQKTHKDWKRCPNCKIFINRTEGCNHMSCRCSHEFCFVCLDTWSQSHYNCVEKSLMFYFNVEQVRFPYLVFALMVLAFPIGILLAFVTVVILFLVMIPAGFVAGMVYTFFSCYKLLCLVVLILPFGGIAGAVILPFFFTSTKSIPTFIHHLRRYKFTMEELSEKFSSS